MREFVGAAWRLQGGVEASREAGGGRSREEVAGARGRARRGACPSSWQRRKATGEGGGGGLGQREELGRLGWTGRRQVGFCSLFFCSVYFYLIYFATVLNLK